MNDQKKDAAELLSKIKFDEPGVNTIVIHNNGKKESFPRKVAWNLGSAILVAILMNFMGLRTIIVCACWGLITIFGGEIPDNLKKQFQGLFHSAKEKAGDAYEKGREKFDAAKEKIDEAVRKASAAKARADQEIKEIEGRVHRIKDAAEKARSAAKTANDLFSMGKRARESVASLFQRLQSFEPPWRALFTGGDPKARMAARAEQERQRTIALALARKNVRRVDNNYWEAVIDAEINRQGEFAIQQERMRQQAMMRWYQQASTPVMPRR